MGIHVGLWTLKVEKIMENWEPFIFLIGILFLSIRSWECLSKWGNIRSLEKTSHNSGVLESWKKYECCQLIPHA